MQFKLIKLMLILTAGALAFGFAVRTAQGTASGAPSGTTGGPSENNCTTCHNSFTVNTSTGSVVIGGLPSSYSSGQQVAITVTARYSSLTRFGFQLTALTSGGAQAGQFVLTDTARTQIITGTVGGFERSYVEQTTAGSTSSTAGQAQWTFNWIAPAIGNGNITFYVAATAGNNNNKVDGDYVYTNSAVIPPTSTPTALATVSSASYQPNLVAAASIASGFGTNLTVGGTEQATTLPLPITLSGAFVYVRDSLGSKRVAPLFFVSPTQINYLVPLDTFSGTATVMVINGTTTVAAGTIEVANVAPGIFTADASGQGVAAATALRISSNGTQTFQPVATFDQAQNKFVAVPIDLGSASDQVFLLLFGSGLRGRSSLSTVVASVGGTNVETLYVGAQGSYVGLDQVNLRLPRTLIGRGNVEVALTVDGRAANTVRVNIN